MKALARAVLNAVAFIELSDDQQIDPDLAIQALDEITLHLAECTEAEKQALAEVVAEMRTNELESNTRPEVLEFLDDFLSAVGLHQREDLDEPPPATRINLG